MMHCCEPGCPLEAEYEVWLYGRPEGFHDCYQMVEIGPGNVVRKYEAYTHSCAQHLLDAKAGFESTAFVVHLSRSESPTDISKLITEQEDPKSAKA